VVCNAPLARTCIQCADERQKIARASCFKLLFVLARWINAVAGADFRSPCRAGVHFSTGNTPARAAMWWKRRSFVLSLGLHVQASGRKPMLKPTKVFNTLMGSSGSNKPPVQTSIEVKI